MPDPLKFIQEGFSGGMERRIDPTRIGKKAYPVLINGRNRYDVITPVRLPTEMVLPETGVVQGIYAAGGYLGLLQGGRAYYRNFNITGDGFHLVPDFQMDETQPTLWAEPVPASTLNYARSLAESGIVNSGVNLGALIGGSPRCVVVNDGINQPRIIESNGTGRVSKAMAEWNMNDREGLPIGRQMKYHNGKLYMVSQDGTRIFPSVTGRPLDFQIPIDGNGDRGGSFEDVAHRVGYDEIACLESLNSPDSSLLVGGPNGSFRVIPDFENTKFGEPEFDNVALFPTGPLNQFSTVDVLGDFTFIDYTGIRSFNAVAQLQVEGKNSPFSQDVDSFFKGIVQGTTCCGKFDNYALYGVKTVHGSGILISDELAQVWAGLDIYPGVEAIRQFAEIKTPLYRKLFFIAGQKLYEAFTGPVAACKVFLGEWCSGDPAVAQRPKTLRAVFSDVKESGTISLTPYVDRKAQAPLTETVTVTAVAESDPMAVPFGVSSQDVVKQPEFSIGRCKEGWKIGALLEWNFDASLSHVSLESDPAPSEESKAGRYARAA